VYLLDAGAQVLGEGTGGKVVRGKIVIEGAGGSKSTKDVAVKLFKIKKNALTPSRGF